jgi:hypothetical protein
MSQKSQMEAVLKIGDRVRLIAETLAWRAEAMLRVRLAVRGRTPRRAAGLKIVGGIALEPRLPFITLTILNQIGI